MFRTDFVFCIEFGRRHSLACHLQCKKSKWCKFLKEHEDEQARLIEIQKQRDILPAYQKYLPGWKEQEWPDEKKEGKKDVPKGKEVVEEVEGDGRRKFFKG